MSTIGLICKHIKIYRTPFCVPQNWTSFYFYEVDLPRNDKYCSIIKEKLPVVVSELMDFNEDYCNICDHDGSTESENDLEHINSSDSNEDIREHFVEGSSWKKCYKQKHNRLMQMNPCGTNFISNNYQTEAPYNKSSCFNKSCPQITIFDKNRPQKTIFDRKPCCCIKNCCSSKNYSTDEMIRSKLLHLNNYIRCANSSNVLRFSNNAKSQNSKRLIDEEMFNKNVNESTSNSVRQFSSCETLYSSNNEEKESIKGTKYDKTWTKQINNCKVTYRAKSKDNFEKAEYTVECKENGDNTHFPSNNNLSTGQKLIGAVLSLVFIIFAAYSTVFLMSLAASVISVLAVVLFIFTCYQIIKKGWKDRRK